MRESHVVRPHVDKNDGVRVVSSLHVVIGFSEREAFDKLHVITNLESESCLQTPKFLLNVPFDVLGITILINIDLLFWPPRTFAWRWWRFRWRWRWGRRQNLSWVVAQKGASFFGGS